MFFCNYIQEPQNSVDNYLDPYIRVLGSCKGSLEGFLKGSRVPLTASTRVPRRSLGFGGLCVRFRV